MAEQDQPEIISLSLPEIKTIAPGSFRTEVRKLMARRLIQLLRISQIALGVIAVDTFLLGYYSKTIAILATIICLFSVDWAAARNRHDLGANILLITLAIMLSYIAWNGSGIRDIAVFGYCGVLVYTAMLGRKRLLTALLAIMITTCLAIAAGNQFGFHVNEVRPINLGTGVIVVIVLVALGITSWLMAHDYRVVVDELDKENLLALEAQKQIEFLALHDPLTRLPNRTYAQQLFDQAFSRATEESHLLALVFIDLDNLKPINDTLGHQAGDEMLQEVSKRLQHIAENQHIICRYGGDEFVMILQNIHDPQDAAAIAMVILHSISLPIRVKQMDLSCTCSIGIAIAPRDGKDLDTLIRKADIAMYQSKDAGRNNFKFFDLGSNHNLFEHLNLANSMRRAIQEKQFQLYYQPKVDLNTQALLGFEALIRWQHPQYGFISPATFISLAESSGVIVQLGEWVIKEACQQGKKWIDKGFKQFSIAVNVSSIQFKRGNIESVVTNALETSQFPASMLELELTESLLIDDTERLSNTLANLRRMGVHLSIDDFGTGYSNLGYLKKFEVEYLKIDQSFVRRMEQNSEDVVIVRAIIQLAASLGIETIAEGVETADAADMLRDFGCSIAQGYLWSRPIPANEVERFWRDWNLMEQE